LFERRGTPGPKEDLEESSRKIYSKKELAGEKMKLSSLKHQETTHPIGGLKVTIKSGWFAARPSGTENIYKIMRRASAERIICSRIWKKRRVL